MSVVGGMRVYKGALAYYSNNVGNSYLTHTSASSMSTVTVTNKGVYVIIDFTNSTINKSEYNANSTISIGDRILGIVRLG